MAWNGYESDGGIVLGARSWSVRAIEQDTAGYLEIPSVLGESLPVVGISEWAFQGCSKLTGVTIPDSVTYISGGAFQDCTGLTTVRIGTNVNALGMSCFQGCTNLQSIEIPDGVTSIPLAAFAYCPSLGRVKLGNGVKAVSGSVHMSVMTGLGGQTVTVINSPFAGCVSLKGIEFGTSIENVGWGAFEHCANLKYAYFPGNLPSCSGTMPGVADRVCYVTHEAYPDGLPDATWAGVPLKYLEGKLPSEEEPYDLAFAPLQAGDDGLVAYYKFNGDAKDSSTYGNDGAVQGVTLTADRHGNANSAFYFDGASHVEVPSSSSLNGVGKSVTCSVWIKPESWDSAQGEWMPILCKGTSIPRNIDFQLSKSWGLEMISDTSYRQDGDPGAYLALPQFPALNEWQMLTYTSDGSTVRFYLNGVCIASTNCTIESQANTYPLLIGKDPPGDLEYFKGAMDEVRIYNRALSDGEVYELYAFAGDDGAVAQIQSPDAAGIPKAKVLHGDPVYLSYTFQDKWGIESITTTCVNRVTLAREPSGTVVGMADDTVESVEAGQIVSRTGLQLPIFQNLECGTYRVTLDLNADRVLGETDYANNTNVFTFTVIPSVEMTFVSEGNTIAMRRYGVGEAFGAFPTTPIRPGFRFTGWFTEEDGGDVVTASSKVPDSSATLYAHWEVVISLTLTVGGTLSAGTTTWTCGNLYEVTSNITVPTGATLTIEPGVIVKFAAGELLQVNSGGTLSAIGTRALPIVFTSIKDDANGGDTNGDGDATTPQAGDWVKVCINGGTATFDYAKILYSSKNATTGAINMTDNGGTVTFTNGEIAHSAYDAVGVESGHCYVRNTVIHDSLLAFRHWTTDPIENCVIYDCGRLTQGGGQHFYNCIFSHITETWEAFNFPNNGTTYRNCCFWNEEGSVLTAEGRQDAKKVCGVNGNIWANPLFVNPENGDFRIAANSPCVDAANGSYAPEKDYYGSPRMNVDVIRNTGTASTNGAVPDIGIYEVPGDGNIPSADLTVTSVTVPETLTVGETVDVSWKVENVGVETASGMWRDEIEIIAANGQVFSMGTSTVQAEIKPGATANFHATLTVPATLEGAVQVRVTANKQQDLFEAMKSENNVGIAAATLAVPTLAVPMDGTATTITLSGDSDYGFKVATSATLLSQGGVLVIRGDSELDAWLGNGSIAAKDNAIRTAVQIADGTWLLQIPAGSEPRVTVRNDGEDSVATSLSIEVGAFFVLDTGKKSAANSGMVTVPFTGNGFDEIITCWLERGGTRIETADLTVANAVSATATFDVTDCEAGDWTLHVKTETDEASVTLLTLTESRIGPKWFGEVDGPDVIRSGRSYVGTFRYGNSGDTATNAPYVRLEAKGDTLIRLSEADAWSKSIELMAASDTAPASVLKPGDSSKVSFFYKTTGAQADIECACTFSSVSNIPWATLQKEMRPSWANDDLWHHAYYVLKARFGETWNDYLARLRDDCDMMLKTGQPNVRVDRIWQLELDAALGNDIAVKTLASATDLARACRGLSLSFARLYQSSLQGRMSNGPLGYGWTHNYSTYAELQDASTLVFHLPSGSSYSFTKASGTWVPADARDKTTLKESATSYTLSYASGTVQTFARSNMRTSSIRDNQGNELTFTYSGTNLTKVAHSDGQSLTFNYSDGKLTSVVDDQGRTTSYTYSGDLLTSVTSFNGLTTTYEYETLPVKLVPYMTNTFDNVGVVVCRLAYSSANFRKSASILSNDPTVILGGYKQVGDCQTLSKITYPDGTTRDFAYDESARVAAISVNGGNTTTTIDRDSLVTYSLTAPNGSVTKVVCGVNGETLRTVNGLGQAVSQTYTADTLLESVIAPSGKRSKITYNKDGSPIASMSASGASTTFSYTSDFDNLASVTDAKGHAFNYSYDELGRSTAVSYVDGSSSTLEYNEKGDVVRSTNRRGETIEYEYDAEGNLVKKTWPNGRTFTLAYDAKGNVTNAADSVTGTVTMEYDANERLTRIVYPKGRGFTYTYDAFGRVTERTMLGGTGPVPSASATQRYTYDSLGRLSRVTDGDNNPYLTNAYDPTTGWLITQTYGNGTIVSNAYDILGDAAAGKVIDRSSDTLGNRAVSLSLCKSLNELVADVAGVKVGEYKNVSLSGYVAAGSLGGAYGRNHSGVSLKLAVQKDVRAKLLSDSGSCQNLVNVSMLCTALRGVGKHGNLRLLLNQKLEGLCGRNSDSRKLLRIGVLLKAGICEEEGAVCTVLAVRNNHHEERGHKLGAGLRLDDLEGRTKGVGRRMACTGNNAVCSAHLNHHTCIVHIVGREKLLSLLGGHTLCLAKLNQLVDICRKLCRSVRIDYGSAGHIKALAVLRNLLGSTEHNYICDSFLQNNLHRFPCSSVHGLRQNDCLLVLFCSLFDAVNKSHDY